MTPGTNRMNKKITTLCIAFALSFAAAHAGASDPSPTQDTCLIGTWVQTGGGPGEWMKERMPNQQLPVTLQQGQGVMVLQPDGRYTASITNLGVEAIHKDPAGFRQSLSAQASAAGRWSASNRRLSMEAETANFTASNDAVTQAAERLRARHSQSGQRGRVFYGCRGNHLTTRTEVRPGETFPTHYQRVRGDGE